MKLALLLVLGTVAGATVARAESADASAPDAGAAEAGAADVAVDLSAAPAPLAPIQPVYTPEAQRGGVAGDIVLLLTIDDAGVVTDVTVEAGLPLGLTESAVAAARAARFRPARDSRGRPMAVRLRWTMHFTLPEVRKTETETGTRTETETRTRTGVEEEVPPNVQKLPVGEAGVLSIAVRERGTGKRLPLALIWIEDVGELLRVDAEGRAQRTLPPGAYAIVVRVPGHHQEERIERLRAGERLERTYFVERERLNEYETIIRAQPPRAETGVVTLQAEEIHTVPGTFGDPFRAALLMPGVSSGLSGLGYPIIRGEAPGQTGTFIDDVKIPLLYHIGIGPAVVHPLYLDSLDFHPGNFPAEFGRFTGGLIRAKTTAPPEERTTMLEVDLFKFSGYHAQPISVADRQASLSLAARYGTFTFLARAFDPSAVLQYWDAQLRADLRTGPGALRLLVFGASDAIGNSARVSDDGQRTEEQILRTGFARADLRYRIFRRGRLAGELGAEAGPDFTTNTDPMNDAHIREWVVRPRAALDVQAADSLKLRFGADTLYQSWDIHIGEGALAETVFPRYALTYGAFAQAEWQPSPAWLIVAGVRADLYAYRFAVEQTTATSVDPRLAVRRRLRPGLFAKAAVGIYHAPPRFLLPWPGLEGFGLRENGLNRSDQVSAGLEAVLPGDVSIDGQVYYNHLKRVAEYDLTDFDDLGNQTLANLARTGRAYGLELIARRRLGHRLFGWVTYTLARSERRFVEAGWRPADFDQTQLVNTIVSYALGRSWTISATFHLNTGRPVTPQVRSPDSPQDLVTLAANRNLDRLPSFWRVDARIEKREAFDTWYLDFYVDWLNISLQREVASYNYSVNAAGEVRRRESGNVLTLPTLGLRAVF